MKSLMSEGWDAIFVGSGAPGGRDLDIPGRKEAARNIHIGIDWLSSVSFGHVKQIGRRGIVPGGGNTPMDSGRSSPRPCGEGLRQCVPPPFLQRKPLPLDNQTPTPPQL